MLAGRSPPQQSSYPSSTGSGPNSPTSEPRDSKPSGLLGGYGFLSGAPPGMEAFMAAAKLQQHHHPGLPYNHAAAAAAMAAMMVAPGTGEHRPEPPPHYLRAATPGADADSSQSSHDDESSSGVYPSATPPQPLQAAATS